MIGHWSRSPAVRCSARVGAVALIASFVAATAPITAPIAAAAPVALGVVAQAFNLEPDTTFEFTVSVPASIDLTTLPEATLVVTAYNRMTSRLAVQDAVAGALPRSADSIDFLIAELPRPQPDQMRVTVPLESARRTATALQLARTGVYPIVIELRNDGEVRAEVLTFVHRLPAPGDDAELPLPLAFAMATLEPVRMDDDTDVIVDEAVVGELTRLADVLEVSQLPVAVRVPPAFLTALRAGGGDQAVLAERLALALERNDLLSSPALPLDPSAAAAAGQQSLYTQWLRDGEDELARNVASPAVRTIAIVDSPLSGEGGALLRDLGARLLVLPTALYDTLPDTLGGFTDTSQLVQVQVSPGVTIDTTVIDRFVSRALERRTSTPDLSAIYTVADLLAARAQIEEGGGDPRRHGITLATPDLAPPPAATFGPISALIAATPGLRPTTLDDLGVRTDRLVVDGQEVEVGLPATVDGDLGPRITAATDVGLQTASTSSMLPSRDPRLAEWSRLLSLLPTSALSSTQVDSIVADLQAELAAIRAFVVVPEGFSFNLTGRTTIVPVRLRNNGDTPITVRVRMSSSKLIFPEGDQTVALAPLGVTEVRVPIETRSNGRFPVTLEVFTPLGDVPLAPPVPLTAKANALSGLGNLVTGAALLVLLTWWVRHVRQSRRKRAAAETALRHPVVVGSTRHADDEPSPDAATSTLPPS